MFFMTQFHVHFEHMGANINEGVLDMSVEVHVNSYRREVGVVVSRLIPTL
jgi:hypothetical protein